MRLPKRESGDTLSLATCDQKEDHMRPKRGLGAHTSRKSEDLGAWAICGRSLLSIRQKEGKRKPLANILAGGSANTIIQTLLTCQIFVPYRNARIIPFPQYDANLPVLLPTMDFPHQPRTAVHWSAHQPRTAVHWSSFASHPGDDLAPLGDP